jgi:hypothetical protein
LNGVGLLLKQFFSHRHTTKIYVRLLKVMAIADTFSLFSLLLLLCTQSFSINDEIIMQFICKVRFLWCIGTNFQKPLDPIVAVVDFNFGRGIYHKKLLFNVKFEFFKEKNWSKTFKRRFLEQSKLPIISVKLFEGAPI